MIQLLTSLFHRIIHLIISTLDILKIFKSRKELIDLCIASKLRIVNGRLDSSGGFTCFTPRGDSVVDYLIVSESLFTIISHFEVGNPSVHSDHCPLLVNLQIILDSSYCPKSASTYLKTKNQFREKNENIIWNQRIKGYVSKSFRSFKFCKLLETLESDLFCSRISLDEIVDNFTQLLQNTVKMIYWTTK